MKNQFRLFSALTFFLFLSACAEKTEIGPGGDGTFMPSSNSALSGLTMVGATLSPAFNSATENYAASVANDVDSTSVTPTAADTNATITVNGGTVTSGAASQLVALAEGDNTITVVVTAEDGSTTTYVILVNRASLSTDASLSNLTISDGTLAPAFDPATQSYAASVNNVVGSITVTPTTNDANATVTVDGTAVVSGSASGSISLNVGDNAIDVVVTAEDGATTQTYTVTVTRDAPPISTDASLSDLTLSAAALDQIFQSNSFTYTATVSYAMASTTVTPTANDANATVTVNGTAVASGSSSGSIALAEGDNTIDVVVTAEDGATTQTYTVTVTRQTAEAFAQQAYIKASNTGIADRFGYSIALDGDTLVIGAIYESGDFNSTGIPGTDNDNRSRAGAAYVFVRNAGVWSQQAYLKADNPQANYWFGYSVAVEGDTVAVGSPLELFDFSGAVYVYTRDGTDWSQQARLRPSNIGSNDRFGDSVSLSGETLVIGAYAEDGDASSTVDNTNDNAAENAGAAYVFTRSGTTWTQQVYLKAFNANAGDSFSNNAIALDGNTLAIGAYAEDGDADSTVASPNNGASNAGAVYVYTGSGANWSLEAYLKASNVGTNDMFGGAISLDGDTLIVGAVNEDGDASSTMASPNENTSNSGAVYVFTRSGTAWTQQAYLKASNAGVDDRFGDSVSLSVDTLIVGTVAEDGDATSTAINPNENAFNAGAAYVFTRSGTTWLEQAYLKASNAASRDEFGASVAVDGDTMAVGAVFEESAATGVNGDQSDNSGPDSGAAYVFQ
jgi:hypothetical protein